MAAGKRIYLRQETLPRQFIDQFKTIPASNTADVMGRNCAMHPRIHLVSSPTAPIMVGSAVTVKCRAGDNLVIHAAMELCNEGDVLVISNEEDCTRALMGEVMMTYLRFSRKVAGVVLDGPIRDIGSLGRWDFPIYCTGTTPAGPYKEGPGEVNVPIACGGISVMPGDIILADADGVIVIPQGDAADILAAAKKFQAQDQAKALDARDGSIDRSWVQHRLREKGFEIVDRPWTF